MRASARGSVFEHDWAEVFEFAGALVASLPVVMALAYLVIGAFDLSLLGPIGRPRLGLVFRALALAVVLPLALSFALAFVLPFALALSGAFCDQSTLVPRAVD